MPSVGEGGGGGAGGGGLHFRVPADTFTGATIAVARTARDTYFGAAANAAALEAFQGDQSLAIILAPTSAANTFETYLPGQLGQSYAALQWVARADAVQSTTPGPALSDSLIKAGYERNPDTNVYTDNEKTKLGGVAAGANVNVGAEYTQAEKTKLGGVAAGANVNIGTEYTQAEKTKVAGVEAGANVNIGTEYTQAEKTKLGGVEAGATADQAAQAIADALDGYIGDALWRSRLTGADLLGAVDLAVGSTIWRTSHTALRNALQIVSLLDLYFGDMAWRTQGTGTGGGGGLTLGQATDAAGNLLATVSFFTYDSTTNSLTLAIPDNTIRPAMLLSTSAAEQRDFRAKIDAAQAGQSTGQTETQVKALIQAALAAAVTGNTETGIVVTYNSDGTYDFVASAAPAPVRTHTNYVGTTAGALSAVTAADFTVSGATAALTIPTYTGRERLLFARPASESDPTGIYLYQVGRINSINQIGIFVKGSSQIQLGSIAHNWWGTGGLQLGFGGYILEQVN